MVYILVYSCVICPFSFKKTYSVTSDAVTLYAMFFILRLWYVLDYRPVQARFAWICLSMSPC